MPRLEHIQLTLAQRIRSGAKIVAWAWRGSHRYYYRSVRDGGRVTKQYVGKGPFAELHAQMDAEEQAEREAKREAWRRKRAEMDAIDAQIGEWWDAGTVLLKAVLYSEGYYQHDRGEWRKRRASIQRCDEAGSQS